MHCFAPLGISLEISVEKDSHESAASLRPPSTMDALVNSSARTASLASGPMCVVQSSYLGCELLVLIALCTLN
jgi:hypothetical protein